MSSKHVVVRVSALAVMVQESEQFGIAQCDPSPKTTY